MLNILIFVKYHLRTNYLYLKKNIYVKHNIRLYFFIWKLPIIKNLFSQCQFYNVKIKILLVCNTFCLRSIFLLYVHEVVTHFM